MPKKLATRVALWGLLLAFAGLAIFLAAALYKTAPRPLPANEVIGHWQAEPGEQGTGDFYEDGTFIFEGLSINALTGKEPAGTFTMSGTWSVRPGDNNLSLNIDEYFDSGDDAVSGSDFGLSTSTLGWGKNRQLYFSDGEETTRYLMNRVSETPAAL